MTPVFQSCLPDDMLHDRPLPGVQPVRGHWLRVDDAYGGQMAQREEMLRDCSTEVLWCLPEAVAPARELLAQVLDCLPNFGFSVSTDHVRCPDGRRVDLRRDAPLETLGRLVQCDFCLLDRGAGGEHVLKGAVLCFPASWRLDEKANRPLTAIHAPVAVYDAPMSTRVQRLFDGVRPGRPLWRFNRLRYLDPALHQPRSEHAPRRDNPGHASGTFLRSERQTILRLPESGWVVFAIHTFVLRPEDVPGEDPQSQDL